VTQPEIGSQARPILTYGQQYVRLAFVGPCGIAAVTTTALDLALPPASPTVPVVSDPGLHRLFSLRRLSQPFQVVQANPSVLLPKTAFVSVCMDELIQFLISGWPIQQCFDFR
jgi:hypothetical protein